MKSWVRWGWAEHCGLAVEEGCALPGTGLYSTGDLLLVLVLLNCVAVFQIAGHDPLVFWSMNLGDELVLYLEVKLSRVYHS